MGNRHEKYEPILEKKNILFPELLIVVSSIDLREMDIKYTRNALFI